MRSRTQTEPCWIVVADGGRARILVRAAHDRGYETIRSIESATRDKRSAALGSERPGRTTERASGLRHAIEPRTDAHQQGKHEFATLIAETINRAGKREDFRSLVLVAPVRQLAAIRRQLAPAIIARLARTIAKDLTKVPDAALAPHIAGNAHTDGKALS
jgi:protein required for attachment to host cells